MRPSVVLGLWLLLGCASGERSQWGRASNRILTMKSKAGVNQRAEQRRVVRGKTETLDVAVAAERGGSYEVTCEDDVKKELGTRSLLSFNVPPAGATASVGHLLGGPVNLDTVEYRTFELEVWQKGSHSDFNSHQASTAFKCQVLDRKTQGVLCQIGQQVHRARLELAGGQKSRNFHIESQVNNACRRWTDGTFAMLALRRAAPDAAALPAPEEPSFLYNIRLSRVMPVVFFVDVWSKSGGGYEVYCDDYWQKDMVKSPVLTMDVPPDEGPVGVRKHTVLKFELAMMNRGVWESEFTTGTSRSFFRCYVTDGVRDLCEVSKSWTGEPGMSRTTSTHTEKDVYCMLKYGDSVNDEFGEVHRVHI